MKALLFVILSSISLTAFSGTEYCKLGEVKFFLEGHRPTGPAYAPARGGEWNINDPHISQIEGLLKNEYYRDGEWQILPAIEYLYLDGRKLTPWVCAQSYFPDINISGERSYMGNIRMFIFPVNQGNELVSTESSVLVPPSVNPYLGKFLLPVLKIDTSVNIPKLDVNTIILNNLTGKKRLNTYAHIQGSPFGPLISCTRGEIIFTLAQGTPTNTYEVDGSLLTTGNINSGERFSARVLVCN